MLKAFYESGFKVFFLACFFSLLTAMAWSSGAYAHSHVEATCYEEDCLKYGWESFDYWNGRSASVTCIEEDCKENGWMVHLGSRPFSEVECRQGGCFSSGWNVYDSRSGRIVSNVTCLFDRQREERDCLTRGWEVFQPGHGYTQVRCINGDCRENGWDAFYPNGASERLRCKRGGCFNKGWIVYR